MKLKQRPDDFRVEEFSTIAPGEAGAFSFYRLEKRGWTTPDALAAVRDRWKVDIRRLSHGGLKDRHAHTIQNFTIHNGPARNLKHGTFSVMYLGRVVEPYSSEYVRANGFTITLRSLSVADIAAAESALSEIAAIGMANYFDDQRFGSVGDGRSFVAREMVLENFEQALRWRWLLHTSTIALKPGGRRRF